MSNSIGFGTTRRLGQIIGAENKRCVLIETDLLDEKRLQVFLSKSMSALAEVELEVEQMTDEAVIDYLAILEKCYVTKVPNNK